MSEFSTDKAISEFSEFRDESSEKILKREESKFLENIENDFSKDSRPAARVSFEVSAWRKRVFFTWKAIGK